MDEQSRRTNILIGDEVLVKIDDTKNVTHLNGVMTVELNTIPNPLTIGSHQIISGTTGLNFKLGNVVKEFASKDDLAGLSVTWENLSGKPATFPPALHDHDLSVLPETVKIGNTYVLGNVAGSLLLSEDGLSGYEVSTEGHLHNSEMAGMTVLFPDNQDPPYWERCDGRAISRTTPQGENLVNLSCPFGVGDGTTTVNLPTLTAPSGFAYYMFIGYA